MNLNNPVPAMLFLKAAFILNVFFILLTFLPHARLKGEQVSLLSYGINLAAYLLGFVLVYSLIKTAGNTVLITILPVIFWWSYKRIEQIEWRFIPQKIELIYLVKLLIIANCIFIFKAIGLLQLNSDYLKIVTKDYVFYAKVSSFLENTGIESSFLGPLGTLHPYHYFELWLNALFINIGLEPYPALVLITYPIILTYCAGIAFILFNDTKKAWIFTLSVLLIQLFSFPGLLEKISFMKDAGIFLSNTVDAPKLASIYLLILLGLLAYRYGKLNLFLWVFTIATAIYGPLIFGAAGVFGTAVVIRLYDKKALDWEPVIFGFLSLLLFSIFYKVNHYQNELLSGFNVLYVKTAINIVFGTLIRLLIIALPYLPVLFLIGKVSLKQTVTTHFLLITVVCLAILSSLSGWALLNQQVDSVQVFTNFGLPFICISLAYLLTRVDYRLSLLFIVLVVGCSYKKYFYKETSKNLEANSALFQQLEHGLFLKSPDEYQNPFAINPYYANPLANAFLINPKIRMYDLSLVDVDINKSTFPGSVRTFLRCNELAHYAQIHHVNGLEAKVAFIKANKSQFLICPVNYTLPDQLKNLFHNHREIESHVIWY